MHDGRAGASTHHHSHASGFSCREQIKHGTGRDTIHVADIVSMALRERA